MSLANLSMAYSMMQLRAQLAEDQLQDLLVLLGQFLIDDNQGAKEWLVELAKEKRGLQ